ncbi:MAG: sugar phosphate isomerase/epimerase [Pirellulales bacterium]|nr:sugar phosphate isomerase/epimerase [Pirellulales bacterium]
MNTANVPAISRRRLLSRGVAAAGLGAAANLLPSALKTSLGEEEHPRPKFKYSICNETFEGWPFEKACKFAARCGYAGVEIAPFTISNFVTDVPAERRRQLRRQAEEAGLKIVGLHWLLAKTTGFHLTSPEAEVRRNTTKYLVELARFCSDLGGNRLIFGSPQQRNLAPGMTKEQGMKYAAEALRPAMPELEKMDVTLALEPLAPAETNFLATAAEAVELIELVDSPRCRLILDCKAMSSEPTPVPELIRKHRRLLVHFHANDPNRRGPGFGKLDFVPIMRALQEIDYRDWVSVEVFDYTPGPERLAKESIDYLRECAAKAS